MATKKAESILRSSAVRISAITAGAAVLYAIFWKRFDVGYYNDDALYLVGAKSLLKGSYRLLCVPGEPLLNDPLPGYPFFLAPFVALFQPHWEWMKLVAISVTLGCIVGTWAVVGGWLNDKKKALALAALFALNPTIVVLSGSVMSEMFFLLLMLVILRLLEKSLDKADPSWKIDWSMGGLLGWAAIVRPQGALLIPAVLAAFLWKKRWTTFTRVLVSSAVVVAGVYARSLRHAESSGNYFGQWHKIFDAWMQGRIGGVERTLHLMQTFLTNTLCPLPWPAVSGIQLWLHAVFMLLLVFVLFTGYKQIAGEPSKRQPVYLCVGVFSILYLWLHALWGVSETRYFVPLIPLALVFLLEPIGKGSLALNSLCGGLCGAVMFASLYQIPRALDQSQNRQLEQTLPRQTFSWIAEQTSADTTWLTSFSPSLYLYTGRRSIPALFCEDRYQLPLYLRSFGIQKIMTRPRRLLAVESRAELNPDFQWHRIEGWLAAHPKEYPVLYRNADEHTTIYGVQMRDTYLRQQTVYQSAMAEMQRLHWREAGELLKPLLKEPDIFPAVWQAYGYVLQTGSSDTAGAEKAFLKALDIDPNYVPAGLSLCRLYQQTKRTEAALVCYQKALDVIHSTGEGIHLQSVIESQYRLLAKMPHLPKTETKSNVR